MVENRAAEALAKEFKAKVRQRHPTSDSCSLVVKNCENCGSKNTCIVDCFGFFFCFLLCFVAHSLGAACCSFFLQFTRGDERRTSQQALVKGNQIQRSNNIGITALHCNKSNNKQNRKVVKLEKRKAKGRRCKFECNKNWIENDFNSEMKLIKYS
ncbi:unnamed protein product [Ceratitis capitata]|uniref:(Mediterranean fruit fly) hypothetical protein n=1 Tax=Ceratitis capitata TaxID=7213 RepID=A0A811V8R8_CERCA|nr:unnamed protein product [Ceratitis capitata]